jgi:hypothetical protein
MKFYVRSNSFQVVVAGPHITSAEEAAKEAYLKNYKTGTVVSPITIVSERGFDYTTHEHEEDHVFDTVEILAKAGFIIEDE